MENPLDADAYSRLHAMIRHVADKMPPADCDLPAAWLQNLDVALARIALAWQRVKDEYGYVPPRGRKRAPVSRRKIKDALRFHSKAEAARVLGISRATLYKLLGPG